jgi:hypothetical protein
MTLTNFIKSKAYIYAVAVFFFLALLLGVFSVGAAVGYHRARLSYKWSENYQKNFAGPRSGFFTDFKGGDFVENYATFGRVIKVALPDIVIQGRDNFEKVIIVGNDTSIAMMRQTIQPADIKVNDAIIVIGEPNNQGEIEAKFIRVMQILPGTSQIQNDMINVRYLR